MTFLSLSPSDLLNPVAGMPLLQCSVDPGPALGEVTVSIAGEVDVATADRLRRTLARAVAQAPLVRLDMSGVTFMDCAGLRVLMSCGAVGADGPVRLVAVSPAVRRLLTLQSLDETAP